MSTNLPFERDACVIKPGIVGAQWWQKSVEDPDAKILRRNALLAFLAIGAVGVTAGVAFAVKRKEDAEQQVMLQSRNALELQRDFGWNFGAREVPLTFDGISAAPFDRDALARIDDDMRPAQPSLLPYYVPTLFQSPRALPKLAPGESAQLVPLAQVLSPISTVSMDVAFEQGRALAALFDGVMNDAAVIVDLPGHDAVAFAAGAMPAFDPVFTFDNWPHPRGVVPAHWTLGACAYFQPLFARVLANGTRADARPLFVLDRARLDRYTDDSALFDNRHLARVPSAEAMRALGVKHVLYVTVRGDGVEMDDLNDDFVTYAAHDIIVKPLFIDALRMEAPEADEGGFASENDPSQTYFYGGSRATHAWFWVDFPWARSKVPKATEDPHLGELTPYVPTPRATPFSSGIAAGARPSPARFGTVPAILAATGVVVGIQLGRSGSWNRASGGYGGG